MQANDLFDSIEEAAEERQAIMEESGQPAESIAAELFRCEVIGIVNRYYPKGDPKPFFEMIEAKRGKEATDNLRNACREAWRREIEARKAQRDQVDSGKVAK